MIPHYFNPRWNVSANTLNTSSLNNKTRINRATHHSPKKTRIDLSELYKIFRFPSSRNVTFLRITTFIERKILNLRFS